jgi:hypothetical protein
MNRPRVLTSSNFILKSLFHLYTIYIVCLIYDNIEANLDEKEYCSYKEFVVA